jgi:hypothetical protein
MKKILISLLFLTYVASVFCQEDLQYNDSEHAGGGSFIQLGSRSYQFQSSDCLIRINYYLKLDEKNNFVVQNVSLVQVSGPDASSLYDQVSHNLNGFTFISSEKTYTIIINYTVKTKILVGPASNGMYNFRTNTFTNSKSITE